MKLSQFINYTINQILNEDRYSNPQYRSMMEIFDVPVDFMWQYREFNRCEDDNLYGDEYINKLTSEIQRDGIKTQIKLQIDNRRGLIIDGNHRLCIAIKLGLKTIPVQVVNGSFGSINQHKANPIDYRKDKWEHRIWD